MNGDEEIYEVKELDIRNMRPVTGENFKQDASRILIIGSPGCGKSVLIRDILFKKSAMLPVGIVQSGTESLNRFYEKFVGKLYIHDTLNVKAIEDFGERASLALNNFKSINPWAFCILDDVTDKADELGTKIITTFSRNGRHIPMLLIIVNHGVTDLKARDRTLWDEIFIARQPSRAMRKQIYETFASIVPTFKLFCQIMDELTSDNTFIHINNKSTSNEWTECLSYYRADLITQEFQMGCPEYIVNSLRRTSQDVINVPEDLK